MTTEEEKIVSLALSNPKFRQKLLDPNIKNDQFFPQYGLKVTPQTNLIDKTVLLRQIDALMSRAAWCVGNACGVGT